MLGDDLQENFDRFLKEVIESGEVWTLKGSEGWALCPSEEYEDAAVVPFWSSQDYVQVLCVDEWASYKPVKITLPEFYEGWLTALKEDDVLVGVNWNADMEGLEIEPDELAEKVVGV